MNRVTLDFIEYMIFFLKQGYSIHDLLDLCKMLDFKKQVSDLEKYLYQGETVDEALLKMNLPSLFKEYFSFFKHDFSIDDALEKTLAICKKREEIKKILIKKLGYPLFMLIFLFVFSIFVVLFLLPQVEILFIDFNIEKSLITEFFFTLLKIIPLFLILVFVVVVSIVLFVKISVTHQHFQYIDFMIEHTRLVKNVICKYYSLKFAIYYDELLMNNYDATTIIELLYNKIKDSDIKMIVYELYNSILEGRNIDSAIQAFPYFSDDFKMFIVLIHNKNEKKSLKEYIDISFMQIDRLISRIIKTIVPLIYGFVASFVIVVYVSIIIPMMNVVSTL